MHQVLARGEAFAITAEFEGVGTKVVRDVAEGVVRVIRHQAMEAIVSA